MKTTIAFRHMNPGSALKDYVNERLERLTKYARKSMEAHVVLSVERHMHKVEVMLSTKGVRAQGVATSSDMYASIDDAVDKVEKTLRRHHDKKVKERTHPGRASVVAS